MSNRIYRNKHTGTIYKKVRFNGTGVVQVWTEKSTFLVYQNYLEIVRATKVKDV